MKNPGRRRERVLTESDADCFAHRNRRQMLFASSTAAAFSATNNIAAFAGSSEWASLNDGSAPGLASPPPSNADPIIKKTERLGLKYELLASGSGDEEVERNDVVDVDYVMRRANGYFIYSNADCGIGCGNGDPERWAIAGRLRRYYSGNGSWDEERRSAEVFSETRVWVRERAENFKTATA